jgi:hypothetical protein
MGGSPQIHQSPNAVAIAQAPTRVWPEIMVLQEGDGKAWLVGQGFHFHLLRPYPAFGVSVSCPSWWEVWYPRLTEQEADTPCRFQDFQQNIITDVQLGESQIPARRRCKLTQLKIGSSSV